MCKTKQGDAMFAEGLLNQFGYSVTPASLAQIRAIIDNTQGFEHVQKHLVALNDKLKTYDGFIGLSSSNEYFKIKNNASDADTIKLVDDLILEWSKKYKIDIKKVENKETYYVLGFKSH